MNIFYFIINKVIRIMIIRNILICNCFLLFVYTRFIFMFSNKNSILQVIELWKGYRYSWGVNILKTQFSNSLTASTVDISFSVLRFQLILHNIIEIQPIWYLSWPSLTSFSDVFHTLSQIFPLFHCILCGYDANMWHFYACDEVISICFLVTWKYILSKSFE